MSTLSKISKTVLKISDIPKKVLKDHWILDYKKHSFVEVHLSNEEEPDADKLTKWLLEKYPNLKRKNSFFIHIDEEC